MTIIGALLLIPMRLVLPTQMNLIHHFGWKQSEFLARASYFLKACVTILMYLKNFSLLICGTVFLRTKGNTWKYGFHIFSVLSFTSCYLSNHVVFIILKNFLPSFPQNDSEEKNKTLRMLFNRENIRFGNPLDEFQKQLRDGNFRPDVSRLRSFLKRVQYKDYK